MKGKNHLSDTRERIDKMTTTAQKIAIMQAFAEGKLVECLGFDGAWSAYPKGQEPVWNWDDFDYRVAETKPSINWDHVSKDYNYLAEDGDGTGYLYAFKPVNDSAQWFSTASSYAASFASFKHGTCDWKDSLVVRPGYEEGF